MLSVMEIEINAAKQKSTKLAPFDIDRERITKRLVNRWISELIGQIDLAKMFLESKGAFFEAAKDNLFAARGTMRYFAVITKQTGISTPLIALWYKQKVLR